MRDPSIEICRCVFMFGVCWLHCCQQGGFFEQTRPIYYLMRPCVVGFVFISGWFGIRFDFGKVLRLVCIGGCGAIMSIVINYLTGDVRGNLLNDFLCSFVKGYWFLWAYIALLLIAPVLNAALEGSDKDVDGRLVPCAVLVFGWSFITHIPILKEYIPTTAGVTALSCLAMAGIYMVARIIRLRKYDCYFRGAYFWGVVMMATALCAIGFSHYDSPFALITAVGLFQLVRCTKFAVPICKCASFIAPSMFSVYILHQAYRGFDFIRMSMNVSRLMGCESCYLQTFLAAIIVFVSCVALDLLRRLSVHCMRLIVAQMTHNGWLKIGGR